ncbi:histidine phosphatase family protein [Streptomyces sp. NPDC049837]|uniref:SixA phosphatase family protein n=1 Tax=Streptomyces sp. NPDC049837 TaxID=3155277 RepID=UPI0034494F7A
MAGLHRLVVLRHAKSARPQGVDDHDRPLAERGLRDAPAAGEWLRDSGYAPDLVLCSTATRARHTWDLAAARLAARPPVRHDRRLYGTHAADLLTVIRETADDVGTLLLVGHNPAVQELILLLAAEALGDALDRVREKFPTAAIAVLVRQGPWLEITPGGALLTDLAVARGPKPL